VKYFMSLQSTNQPFDFDVNNKIQKK